MVLHQPPVDVVPGEIGIEADRLIQVGQCLVVLLLLEVKQPAGRKRLCSIGIDLNRLVQINHCLYGVSLLEVHLSPGEIAGCVIGEASQEYFKEFLSHLILLHLYVNNTHVNQGDPVFGKELKASLVIGGSQLILLLVLASSPSQLIGSRVIGIAQQTLRGILLCTLEIIEHELRHRPEIIGLSKIGLGRDHLVEVLDSQNVILKIEGILADHHHPVGIHL